MTRPLTAAVITELIAKEIHVGLLVELDTSAGAVRVWSGIGNITWSGMTFTGVGELGAISPIRESGAEVRADALTLELSGIPSALISTALTTQYQGRSAQVWLVFFTAAAPFTAAGIVNDPVLLFKGRMDVMHIDEGPDTATITVTAESRLADLSRPRIRRYTDEDQKELFVGDKGLEFVAGLQDAEVHWGDSAGAPGGSVPVAAPPPSYDGPSPRS